MFLFILESIGTSELILIGIIALIFLGPRKLPQIAKTIGKTMADFRNTTNEFKSTWEREVNFEEETQALRTGDFPAAQVAVGESIPLASPNSDSLAVPTITAVQPDMFSTPPGISDETGPPPENKPVDTSDKKNWL
ncbi:MAG TPA: Sec-independent protein translocase protein TatB [Pyrinomonadaceae bacterium]|nr:Sec-independent protein translocase protein TatB [Pyrinomonadaceae bacterium]